MKAGLAGHQATGAGATGPNGAAANGSQRRHAQGIAPEDAELILTVLRELRKGNFSVRMPLTTNGAMGKIAAEINGIIELNERNAKNLSGVARVIGAVAEGDLFQTMELELDGRPLEGQFLRTARTVNAMVQQLRSFTSEVTRVAGEVGTEGKLGGQAQVKGAAGVWKDLTDNVNLMAANLTAQVRNIANVTTAVAKGDLSKKITVDVRGEILELKNTINVMVDQLNGFASEVTRVAREVGTEGKLGGQAQVRGIGGVWKDLTDNVNFMASNLTAQVRNIADVTTAVAKGDLSKKITVDVQGEILELKNTINVMVDQLNAFAREVTRVAREVGTEGNLGGQAQVEGVAGVWKDLTDNVNYMAGNLTAQVRNIAEVTTAVAEGDLSKKITVDVRGEILQLKNTINSMVDQLNAFAGEVTRVAREVGTEGRLGGQASVPGASGTWKDLTQQVNQLAANLTTQVRTEELLKQSQILFAEAQEASKSKSAFLSMAAHELRTPLSVITGYLSMLQDGSIPPAKAEQPLRVLMGKATELNSIVDDLLTAARIEGGTVPTDAKTLDLREMARQAIGRAEARAGLLRAEMTYREPDAPVAVTADREQLARIIDNLINNALTYSAGRPWVKLTVVADGGPALIIEDRGVGIARDKQDKIFERFFRIDDPGLGPQPGTGLGLFISRELAERHGGSLTLEFSELGKGSTFVLRLPATSGAHAASLLSPAPVLEGVPAS